MENFGEKVSFIWGVADLLRDSFKRAKYPDVILPLTVLRRLDCVLGPTKDKVLAQHAKLKGKLENLGPQLRRASGFAFYNTSPFTFERLLGDAPQLAKNLRSYINGFSDNMREVIEKFDFDNTIAKLDEAGLLFLVLERFKNIDLHPDKVSNLEMGYVFEELIRKFNEAMDENPGEHFTPREVIRLMVNMLLSRDKDALKHNHVVRTVYDPCCGSGGMLTIAKDRILEINPNGDVHLFGQEVNPETFAVCKSDLYMKSTDGRDAENIKFGSTLSNDQHSDKRFDYLLTNPPFGKEWKMDQKAVQAESERGYAGRFGAGTPRISDGQLLFLCHLLCRMKGEKDGGSRVAIVMNGSPLFTGDAGSGESEIRRWILENDWLEAIVAMPEQIFYNTGIPTYIWVLTDRKPRKRKRKVQLIDATSLWVPMRKSLGDKRREISDDQIQAITALVEDFKEGEKSKIFDIADFGYRKITVERPLRLRADLGPEQLRAFRAACVAAKEEPLANAVDRIADELGPGPHLDFNDILAALDQDFEENKVKCTAKRKRLVLGVLGQEDESAAAVVKQTTPIKKGTKVPKNPARFGYYEQIIDDKPHLVEYESSSALRDTENVPLKEDVEEFFEREVEPHVADAWINDTVRDHKDEEVGKVGYEINFNRYFYQYQPPRPLEEIEADIKLVEKDILAMLREVAG